MRNASERIYRSGWFIYCFSRFHQRTPIKPATVKGVSIKYRIPAFKPLAGFTPNCEAVFVQIEHCDFLTLFYTNPRFDSALLNIKVRKQFFNKEILIAYCGAFQEFTYPVYHLGQSFKNIIKLTEGKHKLTQKFRQSQFPLIIIGNEVGSRVDSNAVQALFLFFAKKCFLFLNKFNGYNILHGHPSFSNFSDLGIALNTYSPLYKLQSQKTVINEFN